MLITRKLSTDLKRSRWQNLLEIVVTGIEKQIEEVGLRQPRKYLGFLGTLFLFVAAASLCTIIPGYEPPTGSLSTTAALALCVFVAVPLFGIEEQGVGGYLKSYMSRRSSCCRSTSSANFRARWPWPCVCSAT
jgi:F-type H+-transporting ATPase subunit a